MKLPGVRFTVRRMMVAVAVVVPLLGVAYAYRNHAFCRGRASIYAASRLDLRGRADSARSMAESSRVHASERREAARKTVVEEERASILNAARVFEEGAATYDQQAAGESAAAERAAQREKAFDRAAWRPWLPVPPEPD